MAVALLAVVALWLLPRRRTRARTDEAVPPAPVLAVLGGGAAFTFLALLFGVLGCFRPAFTQGAGGLVVMAAAAGIAAAVGLLVRRWSASRRWGDLQVLSLAGVALIAHTTFGAIGVAQQPIDRGGLLAIWLLVVMSRRLRPAAGI